MTSNIRYLPRRTGPYDGQASRLLAYVPRRIRTSAVEAGGMAELLVRILWSAVRHPVGYWNVLLDDMHDTIKKSWFPVSAGIFGFLVFASVLSVQFLELVGAPQLVGPLEFVTSARSFTIWVVSVVVAGVVGAALTADVGARKVREELDAMEVMGVDPLRELAVPRVLSLTFITTLLSIPALLVTLVSMQIGAGFVVSMRAADFYHDALVNLSPIDVGALVVNSVLVGLLVGTVCCYKGFTASGGAIGLGRAVNAAVVVSLVAVFVLQLAYQSLVLGLFPGLGALR